MGGVGIEIRRGIPISTPRAGHDRDWFQEGRPKTMMLQALLVTFREGIESFLIVGIITAYLRKTARAGLIKGVRIGLVASAITCSVGAWLWLQVPNQPLYEGVAALTAAGFVAALLWQTLRAGRHLKQRIEDRVGRAAGAGDTGPEGAGSDSAPPRRRAVLGVALVTALLVTREGLEAVFYLGVQALASRAATDPLRARMVVAGAALGIVGAGVLAWSWTRLARRLNLGVVLRVTAVFLGLFLVQLLVYGVHELAESGVIPGSQGFHDATEMVGPDGRIGQALSYALFAAPLLYLLLARRARAARPVATSGDGANLLLETR